MICKYCEREFQLRPGKPGHANVCESDECQKIDGKEVQKVMALVSYEEKSQVEIKVVEADEAKRAAQRLMGGGMLDRCFRAGAMMLKSKCGERRNELSSTPGGRRKKR